MRCKYCGSQLIHPETQHKTFSTGKAVAGAVTFGVAGAAAGFIGKDKKGYQCGDCGAFMETPMDFITESGINNAIKQAEKGEDRSLYDYFKGQYPNIQANIPATPVASGDASAAISENGLISGVISQKNLDENQESTVKHRYNYVKWEPDAPVYIESIVIEASDSGDLLRAVITNQAVQTIRSAYFQVSVYDDTRDLINERECVYQGINIEPEDKFPLEKSFELDTEVAYRVNMVCQKVSFTDDTVWRREAELQSFTLTVQPKITDETFPRLKYVRNLLKDYSTYDKEADLFLPHKGNGFWQCICGHPVRQDELCPRCQSSYEKLQELLSQKNLAAEQQKAVKARASARAEKTIPLYEEAIKYCKEEAKRREAEKKAEEEARIAAEKREAEEKERRRIQEEEEQALRKAKQKRYLKIAGICAGAFVILAVGVNAYNKYTTKNKYTAGVALMEQGKYEQAIDKFQNITDYKDAKSLLTECTDQKNLADAKQAEEKGDADLATEYYEQLDNEIVNDSKYEYITLHKDSSDAITERYINELWAEGYEKEKIAALINEIYPITINMVLNRSDDDETTNLESATIEDKYDAICFHMTLEGGLAEHKYSLKLVGSTDIEDEVFNESYDGTMPAGIKDFVHVKKNSQHIWGFTKTKYIKIELVDKDTDEVLKTVEMKLDYK